MSRDRLWPMLLVGGAGACELLAGIEDRNLAANTSSTSASSSASSGDDGGGGTTGDGGSKGEGGAGGGGGAIACGTSADCPGAWPCSHGFCTNVSALASGFSEDHHCALLGDGRVRCWGSSYHGQLGAGFVETMVGYPQPLEVLGLDEVIAVGVGSNHTCAVRVDGRVWCWGANDQGQLGSAPSADVSVPQLVEGIVDAVEVAGGASHTCALRTGGTVWCWGWNAFGELGRGSFSSSDFMPAAVNSVADVKVLTVAQSHACTANIFGEVRCWGDSPSGEVGAGTTNTAHASPVLLDVPAAATVAAGQFHTCAVLQQGGGLYCWGSNAQGQLGTGTGPASPLPMEVPTIDSVTAADLGAESTCVVSGSQVRCWGGDGNGQLGNGTVDGSTSVPRGGVTGIVPLEIAVQARFACAIVDDGSAQCWGANAPWGTLGVASLAPADSDVPLAVVW